MKKYQYIKYNQAKLINDDYYYSIKIHNKSKLLTLYQILTNNKLKQVCNNNYKNNNIS